MLAVEAAGLQGSETVYDVCAAPGGKSFLAADILRTLGKENCGHVCSFDLTQKKTDRIREGAARLHLPNLTAAARDARTAPPEEEGAADVLLCDLPCSGLGVISKKGISNTGPAWRNPGSSGAPAADPVQCCEISQKGRDPDLQHLHDQQEGK